MAESFGTDAEGYDRARPGYPGALVERIIAGSPGPSVLDVGCGTGIAARQFQRTFVLAEGIEVVGADLRDGLLSVDLIRPRAERVVRRIEIQGRG